jgi:hypothetical protein
MYNAYSTGTAEAAPVLLFRNVKNALKLIKFP